MCIRGRSTGQVAGCSKAGGLICQGLSVLGLVAPFGAAATVLLVPVVAGLGLTVLHGRETPGHDLRELERIIPGGGGKGGGTGIGVSS